MSNILFTKSYLHQLVFNENHYFVIVNTKLKNYFEAEYHCFQNQN